MPPSRARGSSAGTGLASLRQAGTVGDLLFLYECTTRDVGQLRPVARRLGLTVQAASHRFRALARRGLVEQREGRYRPTVAGVAWLHATLDELESDLTDRLERLHIVRTTPALARGSIAPGESVVLSVEDGVLSARPGGGPSRGVARNRARPGELVEVAELQGIVPMRRGTVRVVVLPSARIHDRRLPRALAKTLASSSFGLLAAQGLEAYHLLQRSSRVRPVTRFGIAAALDEASHLGIDCAVVVIDREVPRLLDQFEAPNPPALEFVTLSDRRFRRSGSG